MFFVFNQEIKSVFNGLINYIDKNKIGLIGGTGLFGMVVHYNEILGESINIYRRSKKGEFYKNMGNFIKNNKAYASLLAVNTLSFSGLLGMSIYRHNKNNIS